MNVKRSALAVLAVFAFVSAFLTTYKVGFQRGEESAISAIRARHRHFEKDPIRPAQLYELLGEPHTRIAVAGLAVEFFNRTDVTIQVDQQIDQVIGIESSSDRDRFANRE